MTENAKRFSPGTRRTLGAQATAPRTGRYDHRLVAMPTVSHRRCAQRVTRMSRAVLFVTMATPCSGVPTSMVVAARKSCTETGVVAA
jgi:hypothetical protein